MKRFAPATVVLAATLGTALPAAATSTAAAKQPAQHSFGLRIPAHPANRPAQRPRVKAAPTPTAVDLTPWAVPVGTQGKLNSCVAWAIDYAMVGWYSRRQGHPGQPFAPMYAYAQIQAMHGWSDGGAFVDDAMRIAEEQGIDTQADYPQGNSDWRTQPTAAQHAHAAGYRMQGSRYLYQSWTKDAGTGARASIESAVASGHPVALSIPAFEPFEHLFATSGPLTVADIGTSPVLGYHEVLIVGYDATGVRIQNSWGTGWGDHGFATLGWDFVEQESLEAAVVDGFADSADAAPAVGSVAPSRGPLAATTVTIRGLAFDGAQKVMFGDVAATSFTVVDDTTIVASAPAARTAGTVPVRVVGVTGTSTTAATYSYLPPQVTSVLPAVGGTGGGTVVTLHGSDLRQVTSATIGGAPVASLDVVDDTLVRMTAPAHAAGQARVRLVVGTSSYDAGTFRYVRPPVIRRVQRLSAHVAVVHGVDLGPAPRVLFGQRPGRVVASGPTVIRVVVPNGRRAAQVRVSTAFGVSPPRRLPAAPR